MLDRADEICRINGRANPVKSACLATVLLSLALASCSAMPDAVRPGFIYGSEGPAEATSETKGFPNLADVPDQAPAATSLSDQQQIVRNLSTDRSDAQRADEVLRSGSGEVVVASGSAEPGAAEKAMRTPDPIPAPPTMAPAPHTPTPPMSAPEPAPATTPMAAAPSPAVEPTADEELIAAAHAESPATEPAPSQPTESQRTAALAPALSAGTEAVSAPAASPAAPAPAAVAPPAPEPARVAAVEPEPALSPPMTAGGVAAGGVIPFPSRGGHRRITDIKGGIELTELGVTGSRAEIVETEGEVNAAPTTPIEVQPVQ